jgi:hypothetical protein
MADQSPPSGGIIQVGDVIALGLHDGTCPVGMVSVVDDRGVRLDLFSFLTGYFGHKVRAVFWTEIATVRHAQEIDNPDSNSTVPFFDTAALGAFQTEWEARPREASGAMLDDK